MNDKELLELAAKAAGHTIDERGRKDGAFLVLTNEDGNYIWNPLTNDGDALRLAVDLYLTVLEASVRLPDGNVVNVWPGEAADRYAATRRAIVRAAAEVAKRIP